jgi:Zn-finger nucleic acid-binding protein
MNMLCPKCHSLMHAYERNGVVVDQCTECRGIFLDRGELEHLVDAEARFNGGVAPRPRTPPVPPPTYPPAPAYPPNHPQPAASSSSPYPPTAAGGTPPGRSPMADLSTIASIATEYLGKSKGKKKGKKGNKSFIDGLFG